MNIFDKYATGVYTLKCEEPMPCSVSTTSRLSDEVKYLLAKQLPSIKNQLYIESDYGRILIDDQNLIGEIKMLIEKYTKLL